MITQVLDRSADRRRPVIAAHVAALAAALMLIASPADARPQPFRSPSKSIETSTVMVSLPSPGGTVVVARGCDTCDPVSMHLAPGTVYRIGQRDVDFVEFREKARSGNFSMTVHYHARTLDVLQLRLDADE